VMAPSLRLQHTSRGRVMEFLITWTRSVAPRTVAIVIIVMQLATSASVAITRTEVSQEAALYTDLTISVTMSNIYPQVLLYCEQP
jgi:hypothetical protein